MMKFDQQKTARLAGSPGETGGDSLRITWIISAAAALAIFFGAYQALQSDTWQYYLLVAIPASLLLACRISSLFIRRGRTGAIWILIVFVQVAIFSTSVFFAGLGLICLVGILALTILIAFQTLPTNQTRWAIYLSLLFCTAVSFVEWLGLDFQVATSANLKLFLIALISLVLIALILLFTRNLHQFSLRAQLMTMFILVSTLSIGIATAFSVLYLQRNLTNEKNMQLYQAAVLTARQVDKFITSTLNAVSTETQFPELSEFLSLSPEQRLGSPLAEKATKILSLLHQKDPQYIASYALFDQNGIDIIDTSGLEIGRDKFESEYLKRVRETGKPFASNVEASTNFDAPIMHFCAPVKSEAGDILGALCARYFISTIGSILDANDGLVGEGSHAFLIDENHIRLAHGSDPSLAFQSVVPLNEATRGTLIMMNRLPVTATSAFSTNLPDLEQALNRSDTYPVFTAETGASSQPTAGNASPEQGAIVPMQTYPWKIVYVINRSAFLAPIEAQTRGTIITALVVAALAALSGLWVAQFLTLPISQLTTVARQIAEGDMSAQAPVVADNELGTLSSAFNKMTSQLRLSLQSLEERVEERTNELTHRANQLQASAEVGSAIASIRTLDELLPKITQQISHRFGFYHVGIFLIDPAGEYAVLRAANSEGGKQMLARNHQLRVNEEGIVGYVTGKKEPRIAMDVGKDAVFFNNPDLPETRSEMALPLKVGDRILGALDVQSTEPDAFTHEDIATLQLLADQVAIAIENARLFSENQTVLEGIHRAYRELSREAWIKLIHTHSELGTIANKYDILYTPGEGWSAEMIRAAESGSSVYTKNGTVAIPIKEKDHILGVLRLSKPVSESWSKEELALAETLAQQLYLALENARLFQEAQRRAVRERLASEITGKMRMTNDPQFILQTAVQELRQALNLPQDRVTRQQSLQSVKDSSNSGGNAS